MDGDVLTFTAPAGRGVTVGGFTSPTCGSSTSPIAATRSSFRSPRWRRRRGYVARIDAPGAPEPRTLYRVHGGEASARPAAVPRDAPSSWSTSHDGELLILSHAAFLDALAPAGRAPQAGGLDACSSSTCRTSTTSAASATRRRRGPRLSSRRRARTGGCRPASCCSSAMPRSIRATSWAAATSTSRPRGSSTPRPWRRRPTTGSSTSTLDGVPELAIGRMPVRTAAEAARGRPKTLGYAGIADLSRGGLFVTDHDEDGSTSRRPAPRRRRRWRTSCPSICSGAEPARRRPRWSRSWTRARSW